MTSRDDIGYAGPTGRELPGEHWNARIIREMAAEAEHHIQPFPTPVNQGERVRAFTARCTIHNAVTLETWSSFSQAGSDFRCDGGHNLRFLHEFHGDGIDRIPGFLDLSGVARLVRGDAEARAYGADYGETHVWLWLGGGRTEELVITLAWIMPFALQNYATQCWQIARQGGAVLAEVHIKIALRA
jgi:hypothetical protein